jgi:hypothetical protein
MIQAPVNAPEWAHDFALRVANELQTLASVPIRLPVYTVTNLPKADRFKDCWIKVSNETGGDVPCFSDGTNWRRCTDRAIAS